VPTEDDDFHEFDPYQTIVDISQMLEALAASHHMLIEDYEKTKKALRNANMRISIIQKQLQELNK